MRNNLHCKVLHPAFKKISVSKQNQGQWRSKGQLGAPPRGAGSGDALAHFIQPFKTAF